MKLLSRTVILNFAFTNRYNTLGGYFNLLNSVELGGGGGEKGARRAPPSFRRIKTKKVIHKYNHSVRITTSCCPPSHLNPLRDPCVVNWTSTMFCVQGRRSSPDCIICSDMFLRENLSDKSHSRYKWEFHQKKRLLLLKGQISCIGVALALTKGIRSKRCETFFYLSDSVLSLFYGSYPTLEPTP